MSFYKQDFLHLNVNLDESILWIELNRPDKKNAISSEMIESLTSTLIHADEDPLVKVIILGAIGDCFCAGGDIQLMKTQTGMFAGGPNELRQNYRKGIQKIPLTMESMQKPIIAMIDGPAIGAGCDLTCMCDMRIGSQNALFAETFTKIGLVPGDGGTYFLPRIVGFPKAMEMFLTGRKYDADEALKMGLLNSKVDQNTLREETHKLAKQVALNCTTAIGMTKRALLSSCDFNLKNHLDMLAAYQGIAQRDAEHFDALNSLGNNK